MTSTGEMVHNTSLPGVFFNWLGVCHREKALHFIHLQLRSIVLHNIPVVISWFVDLRIDAS